MKILIVESRLELGRLWQRHLERQNCEIVLASGQTEAIEALSRSDFQVIILMSYWTRATRSRWRISPISAGRRRG